MGKEILLTLFLVLISILRAPAAISTSYIQYPQSPVKSQISPRIKELRVLYSWRTAEFAFPTLASREALIEAGHYIPGNAVILDSDYFSKGSIEKLIVTLPRMKPGIPATLAIVNPRLRAADHSPLLQPYPDWTWHGNNDCEGLISVFRTKVDECGRLWVLDSGVIDALGRGNRICPPKILVFDLVTDTLEMKYVFPESVLGRDSFLVSIAVDIRSGCLDAFAYVADVTEFGLIVFDARSRRSWRVMHNYFYPFPTHGSFNIAGEMFDLMDGLVGLALSPNMGNGFLLSADVRPSQSAAEDMSKHRILFFGLLTSSSIACWNARLPFVTQNIVTLAQSNTTLQFPSGVKVVEKDGKEELLVTTSRFHSYFLGTLDPRQQNYHILSASVPDLVKDTMCDPSNKHLPQRLLFH